MDNKPQRKESREQIIGDVLWSYAAEKDEKRFEGAIVNESTAGLSILTGVPVEEGKNLRIYCKGLWKGPRLATVIWCQEVAPSTYRSGLSVL